MLVRTDGERSGVKIGGCISSCVVIPRRKLREIVLRSENRIYYVAITRYRVSNSPSRRHVTGGNCGGGVRIDGTGTRGAGEGAAGGEMWEWLLWLKRLLFSTGARSHSAKLCSGELSQSTLQSYQGVIWNAKIILCHSIRPSSAGDETKLPCLIFGSKLSDAVVRPLVDFRSIVLDDDDGLAIESDEAGASVIANISDGAGIELYRERSIINKI